MSSLRPSKQKIPTYDLRRLADSVECTISNVDYPTRSLVKDVILTCVTAYVRGRKIRKGNNSIVGTAWELDRFISNNSLQYPKTSKSILKLHMESYYDQNRFNNSIPAFLDSQSLDGQVNEFPLLMDGRLVLAVDNRSGKAFLRFGEYPPIPFANLQEIYQVLSVVWEGTKKVENVIAANDTSSIHPGYESKAIQEWSEELSDG